MAPVHQNARSLPELGRRVERAMRAAGRSYELLLVDDASPDDSRRVALELRAASPAVGLLALGSNLGQQAAILAGLGHAAGRRAVLLDADLQDPPEAIPALLGRLSEGLDAVFAGRRGRYQSAGRRLTARVFRDVQHRLYGVPRDAGLFVALSARMVGALLAHPATRPRIVPMIGLSGLPTVSIPVRRERRRHGRSSYSHWMRWRSGLGAVAFGLAWRRRRREAEGPGRHRWPIDFYRPPAVTFQGPARR